MSENPNPTRMELIKSRQRISLARKGHKLLKQKRDVLIIEFFKILSAAKDLRSELNSEMANAYKSIIQGTPVEAPTTTESFKVLISELRSLGLSIELLEPPASEKDELEEAVDAKEAEEKLAVQEEVGKEMSKK